MPPPATRRIERHLTLLRQCVRCPAMHKPVVAGRPVSSRILLVGQAPGDKEPVLGRPFAWTAGKTLFKWFHHGLGWSEEETRNRIYFAAVCRCFPGKNPKGGDRVPSPSEIGQCRHWLETELDLLHPGLILPVGKLAIAQFLPPAPLIDIIGNQLSFQWKRRAIDIIPLPHPSGASPWHRIEPGKTLLQRAIQRIASHPAARIS